MKDKIKKNVSIKKANTISIEFTVDNKFKNQYNDKKRKMQEELCKKIRKNLFVISVL